MPERLIEELRGIVGENGVLVEEPDLEGFSHDETASEKIRALPRAVVKPSSEEQVARIVRRCAELGIPVTARGGGTGLAGACVPSPGGIIMSLERLNRILEVDRHNQTITAQAGVPMGALFEEVKKQRHATPRLVPACLCPTGKPPDSRTSPDAPLARSFPP